MPSINKHTLETDDSSLYHCDLNPCRYCSIEPCEVVDASGSISITSICPYFWQPIPQTEDEMNEQMRLDYEQQEGWEETNAATQWCKEYFGHD